MADTLKRQVVKDKKLFGMLPEDYDDLRSGYSRSSRRGNSPTLPGKSGIKT